MSVRRTLLVGGCMLLLAAGIRVTVPHLLVYAPSASLRKGWYVRDFAARDIEVGDLVVVTMPQDMRMTAEYRGLPSRLLKHVAGIPGNRVCWNVAGMTVVTAGGTAVYPYHAEKIGMRRAETCLAVPREHLILVGTHPRSFDSRYIGVVDGQLFQFRVVPLWTWEAA